MKKLLIILISVVSVLIAVSFAACSNNGDGVTDEATGAATEETGDGGKQYNNVIESADGDNVLDFNDFGTFPAESDEQTAGEKAPETQPADGTDTNVGVEETENAETTTTEELQTTPVPEKPETKPEITERAETEKVTEETVVREETTTAKEDETDEREGWTTGWY